MMSWYTISLSIELFCQIFLYLAILLALLSFFHPNFLNGWVHSLKAKWADVDFLVKVGFWGSLIIIAFVVIVSGFEHCDDGVCKNKLTRLLAASPSEVGDAMAGLASALAFLWIIITVLLQSRELREQRMELFEQRQEFERMNDLAEKQRFEATFFQMLDHLSHIVENLRYKQARLLGGGEKFEGREVISHAKLDLFFNLENAAKDISEFRVALQVGYDAFWENYLPVLSHYFRFLFNFLKLLDETNLAKLYHIKLLRSQISNEELTLLYYNCLSGGGRKLEKYAVKFELFDNLFPQDIQSQEHARFIDCRVFGPNKRGMQVNETSN